MEGETSCPDYEMLANTVTNVENHGQLDASLMDCAELSTNQTQTEDADDEDGEDTRTEEDSRHAVISRFENIVLSFLSQLARGISVPVDSGAQRKQPVRKVALQLVNRKRQVNDEDDPPIRSLVYPHGSVIQTRQLTQLITVIDAGHEALTDNIPVTKRDIYYRDVQLFQKQSTVDNIVDDLACTLDVSRADLNIRAALKGLFCGSGLRVLFSNGTIVTGNDTEAALVPQGEDISSLELDPDTAWILIVEKEAIFQSLCSSGFAKHHALRNPGIIITGKGYPDRATRQFVKTLEDNLPITIPILALVDADAFGLDIVSVYKFGSRSMRHENHALAANRVTWIGVQMRELESLGVDKDQLLPLSAHDHRKALSILRSHPTMPHEWRRELMTMLHIRRKAEIEILSSASHMDNRGLSVDADDNQGIQNPHIRPPNLIEQYLITKINSSCSASQ